MQSTKTPPQTTASSYWRVKSTPLWQSLNKKTYILMVHLWAQNVMECFGFEIAKQAWCTHLYPKCAHLLPVVSLSEPASYIQSRRWPCSQVWLHRCWPGRRLRWYSHWWGSHSYRRQLDNKIEDIWYSERLCSPKCSFQLCRCGFVTHEHTLNQDANIPPLDSITLLSPIFNACDTGSCQLRKICLSIDS